MKAITPQPLLKLGQVLGRTREQWPVLKSGRVVACHTGRAAIYQACRALNLSGPGRVLVPAYHCGAEVAPYQAAGLDPEFYPVGSDLSIDLQTLETFLKPGVKVIHLTHFFGFPGPVAQVAELAALYNLPLIEDAAHGLYSQPDNKPLGSTGTAAVYSLPKTLPVSDGGLFRLPPLSRANAPSLKMPSLTARYRGLRRQAVRKIRHHLGRDSAGTAKTATGWKGAPASEVGFDPISANWSASPLAKTVLSKTGWQEVVRIRRANYHLLKDLLSPALKTDLETLIPKLPEGVCPWALPLRVRDPLSLSAALKSKGVAAWPVWAYFHPRFDPGAMPEATDLKRSIMALPIHQDLSETDCRNMARVVLQTIDNKLGIGNRP